MVAFYRAASIAAVSFCTAFGVAAAAPSFAETVNTAVSSVTNEQILPPVPTVEPLPVPPSIESAPEAAPVETAAPAPVSARPKAATLNHLVDLQSIPQKLDRETECLAASVYFESKTEPLEGQLAVAEVIINRAKSGRFASSICGVVFQKGQFSFVRGSGFPPIARNSYMWREAVAIAQIALNDHWDSRASKALFFHAKRVAPGWNKVRVAQLGNHVFYR
ncbi:cell wall hydrolase [Sphingomonas sp.]|jgi:spore germination cell wall hydrolase CwlJ-like protein|uniref:cell wall hydrolase n=1 Tax=Sphingomonas sp. TaxID=28214 RepID=UPI002DF19833|nr:cell wall hydrolase [Sphingomonas sp.]HEV2569909.1 cell wall hydrolase [Sphingomonas sp.]